MFYEEELTPAIIVAKLGKITEEELLELIYEYGSQQFNSGCSVE